MNFTDLIEKIVSTLFGLLSPFIKIPKQKALELRLISHRGCAKNYIENTLSAFEQVHLSGVYGVEFDIRWTADNIPILLHDPTTLRVFPNHQKLTVDKESIINIKNKFPEIPTLQEVVDRFGKKLHLMIEVKTVLSTEQQLILKKILAPLTAGSDYHLMAIEKSVLFSLFSFDKRSVLAIAFFNPKEMLSFTIEHTLGGLTGHFLLISPKIRQSLISHNLVCGTGFIDTKTALAYELGHSTPYLFSNKAIELQAFCKEFTNFPK